MYTTPDYQLPNNWNQQGFDDSSWSEGASGIGYGDDDDATVIAPTISLYMRKEFQIFDVSHISRIILDIDYDDAFIAYLNGVEIGRGAVGRIQNEVDRLKGGIDKVKSLKDGFSGNEDGILQVSGYFV